MKKTSIAVLIIILSALCCACGASSNVEGTWYSVKDATMYNFDSGEITVAGVIVGQYEDNGDSVVISLIEDTRNLQLYVTKMEGTDVLADVKKGEGNIFFCKGLENAERIIKEEAERVFTEYIQTNIYGLWKNQSYPNGGNFDFIEIHEDGQFITHSGTSTSYQRWTNLGIGYINDELGTEFTICNEDGSDEWRFTITLMRDTYETDSLYFGEIWMEKVADE